MLKWTNAATQATALITTNRLQSVITSRTPSPSSRTPIKYKRKRYITSLKENTTATSPLDFKRQWSDQAILLNTSDTLNCHHKDATKTPKSVLRRNKRRRTGVGQQIGIKEDTENVIIQSKNHNLKMIERRHSIGFSNMTMDWGKYAQTLPLCAPLVNTSSTALLSNGQELVISLGLDPILSKQRYCNNSNDNLLQVEMEVKSLTTLSKDMRNEHNLRNLDDDFVEIDQEINNVEKSSKMDDEALDKLIDAILDSARKTETRKKKLSRKSINLCRRSLLKNNGVENERIENLSSTYTAGLDPANDLNL